MKITGLKSGKKLRDILQKVQDWIFEVGIENASDQDVMNYPATKDGWVFCDGIDN